MRIDALMSTDLATVRPETDLRVAIGEMRSHDCGFLPVVEGNGGVVGVLTDRDVALALGTDDVRPSERSVADVMTREPHTCRVDESAHEALLRMRGCRVRRLPVVDEMGHLAGAISIDDLVLVAQNVRAGADRVSFEQVMEAVEALAEHSSKRTRLGVRRP